MVWFRLLRKDVVLVLPRFLGLLVLLQIFELALLVWLCEETSLALVLALVVGSGLAGSWLLRRQARVLFRPARPARVVGGSSGNPVFDGFAVMLAGVLLIMPGVLTDLLALALLLPPSRRLLGRGAARWVAANFTFTSLHSQRSSWGPTGFPASGPGFAGRQESFAHDRVIEARVIEPRVVHTDGPQA